MSPTRPRFLLAQRASVDGYPPVLHQARILSAIGDVTILDFGKPASEVQFLTPADVRRIRIPANGGTRLVPEKVARLNSALAYQRAFRKELATNPDVVIAFEPEAAAMLLKPHGLSERAPLRIVHLHEHPVAEGYAKSFTGRVSLRRTLERLSKADAVVVADEHRASELAKIVALPKPPIVVMNCPMSLAEIPFSRLKQMAQERGANGPIIHYHGAVGEDHGLEVAIESMKWLPKDVWFFIIGGSSTEYVSSLEAIAESAGVQDRVVFVGRVPYDQVFSFAAGASVGLSMLDTSKPNWRYAAGASNKRFEYMALGVPQVTNDGPGMAELFADTGVAMMADPGDPGDVARKISTYLESAEIRNAASSAARELHLSEFNYERQFEPVLDVILRRRHS